MNPYVGTAHAYLSRLTTLLESVDRTQIDSAVKVIADAWQAGRQIITLGNGGSSLMIPSPLRQNGAPASRRRLGHPKIGHKQAFDRSD